MNPEFHKTKISKNSTQPLKRKHKDAFCDSPTNSDNESELLAPPVTFINARQEQRRASSALSGRSMSTPHFFNSRSTSVDQESDQSVESIEEEIELLRL